MFKLNEIIEDALNMVRRGLLDGDSWFVPKLAFCNLLACIPLDDEAKKVGVRVQIHAVSPQTMMAAVDAGVVDHVLPLDAIAGRLVSAVRGMPV